ncbi:hypothetical protein D3C83_192400 [compost metagenome]
MSDADRLHPEERRLVRLRPDYRLLLLQAWETDAGRLGGVGKPVGALAKMAA